MNTMQNVSQNRIIAPICFGVALLIGIIFLRPLYTSYIEKTASHASLEKTRIELIQEHDILKSISNGTGSTLSALEKNRITKITKKYNTSNIMSVVMLNDFTKDTLSGIAPITISSINISK